MKIINWSGKPNALVDFNFDPPEKIVLPSGKAAPLYQTGDSVRGFVKVSTVEPLLHQGIQVQLVGTIQKHGAGADGRVNFLQLCQILAPAGVVQKSVDIPFSFNSVQMDHESYVGATVEVSYLLKVTIRVSISRLLMQWPSNITHTDQIWVYNYAKAGTVPRAGLHSLVKMDVGIENCLRLEIKYEKSHFHLDDKVTGRVRFLLVRLKIKLMELSVIRKEVLGPTAASGFRSGAGSTSTVILQTEILDGEPVKGDVIPIRLYLGGLDLTPTMNHPTSWFVVRYYLRVVLVDEDNRKYFKQSEITLYRARPGQDEADAETDEGEGDRAAGSGRQRRAGRKGASDTDEDADSAGSAPDEDVAEPSRRRGAGKARARGRA